MTAPRVSVLLPVRNAMEFLDEAVESVLNQTLDAIEVVAVDDGSTDASGERLDEWADRNSRVRVIRSEHAGIVAALERARAVARAPILARMDADDVARPERLARQLERLDAEPEWVGCGAHTRYFPPDRVTDGARRYEAWLHSVRTAVDVDRELFVECPLAHPTFMIRADAVRAVGGYRDMGWPEDYDLLLRLRARGPLGVVPEVLLDWRDHDARLSRTHPSYDEAAFRACKVAHLIERVPDRPFVVWGAGPVGKAFARALQREGAVVRAFVDLDPRKLGQTIHGATVVSPDAVEGLGECFVLVAVGQPGARAEIRDALAGLGRVEGPDFIAVA